LVYALADCGARLLIERDGIDFANVEWSRKKRCAGRPCIDYHLEIVDLYIGLHCATRARGDVRLIHRDQTVATSRINHSASAIHSLEITTYSNPAEWLAQIVDTIRLP